MTLESILFLGYQTLVTTLLISTPMLLTALIVGTLISILQAVTQVQEMTLVFVPKIVAVMIILAVFGGWMLQQAVSFGVQTFESIQYLDE